MDALEDLINSVISWNQENKINLNDDMTEDAIRTQYRERLLKSSSLQAQLSTVPNINTETVMSITRQYIQLCLASRNRFFTYSCKKLLQRLFTKYATQELYSIYQTELLVKLCEVVTIETKIAVLDISENIVSNCDRRVLYQFCDIISKHWYHICSCVLENNKEGEVTHSPSSAKCKVEHLHCTLVSLWTSIITRCFSYSEILKDFFHLILQPLGFIWKMLHSAVKDLDIMLFKCIMLLLNSIVDYCKTFVIQADVDLVITQTARDVLLWLHKISFNDFPLSEDKGFGGELTLQMSYSDILNSKEQTNSSVTSNITQLEDGNIERGPSLSQLQKISLLVFKAAAITARFGRNDHLASAMETLCKLDMFMSGYHAEDFQWIPVVFLDQDDSWIESLLTLLDIYLYLNKRCPNLKDEDVLRISPHKQFLWFLQMTDFDHSIVVDLLVSPETCFLLYLTKYLKVIQNEWQLFIDTLNHMKQGKSALASVSHAQDTTSKPLEDICVNEKNTNMNDGLFEQQNKNETCVSVNSDSKHCTYDCSDVTSVKQWDSASSVLTSAPESDGLALLSSYEDSDDDKVYDDSADNDEEEEVEEQDDTDGTDCDSEKSDSLLDRTMAVLIRTRLKLQEFSHTKILSYNAEPLLSSIECCEYLYENT